MARELIASEAESKPVAATTTAYWVLAALCASSIEPIVVKLGYRDGISPVQLLVLRNVFAAATILLIMRRVRWLGWKSTRAVAAVAMLLLTTNGLVLFALRDMSAIAVVTAMTTTPAFVALVSRAKGRVELSRKFWLGFSGALIGVLLTVDAFSLTQVDLPVHGVAALVVAVASSTIYRSRMDVVTRMVEPKDVSTWIFLINAVFGVALIWPWVDPIPTSAVPVSIWIGAAAALANVAFLSAIRLVGATRMSIFDMLQRPMVIVFAAIVLAEPFTWQQALGVILVLCGVRLAKPSPTT